MGNRLKVTRALKKLRNKRIRINWKVFSNPIQPKRNIVVNNQETSFVDLHLQVAQEVDTLLANLENNNQQVPEPVVATAIENNDLSPEKILSEVHK